MTKLPCRLEFNRAQKLRAQYQLKTGRYKLEEADKELSKYLSSFDKIVDYRNGKNRQPYGQVDLGGFLACEMHTRLRNIPTFLSDLTAYKVLPGCKALTGDGVPAAKVELQYGNLTSFSNLFVADCDDAHRLLKGPITEEYTRLEDGSSNLIWLTKSLKSRVEALLVFCEREKV
jgi:hypothetical protein|tara:strand:+ start:287 stop:808 length:522 start_codon:yes stop_codon:yes gene_type:complete